MVMLRDSDQSREATLRYIEEGAYLERGGDDHVYERRLREGQEMIDAASSWSLEEAAEDQRVYLQAEREGHERFRAEAEAQRERYEAMLAAVEAWEPPSEGHREFKGFMRDQLLSSIQFDCREIDWPVTAEVSPEEWRARRVKEGRETVDRYYELIRDREERNEKRRVWVESLVESLGVPVHG